MPADTTPLLWDALERALAECASEPIERPGAIQSFGIAWVLDSAGRILQRAGETARRSLIAQTGGEKEDHLDQVLAPELAAKVARGMHGPNALTEGQSRFLGRFEKPWASSWDGDSTPREALLHRHAGRWLLELIETGEDSDSEEQTSTNSTELTEDRDEALENLVGDLAKLLVHEETRAGVLQDTAARLRSGLGYDRVMIYRFDEEWNGEVIAEARRPDLEPYLGLRYPASDIPAQARALYQRHQLRVLGDVATEPVPLEPALQPGVDLAPLLCRALSPVHRRYLTNMGVRATLSVSIVVEGRLWGLIACHHQTPRVPRHAARRAALIAADLIAGWVKLAKARAEVDAFRRAQQLLRTLPQVLRIGSIAEWEQLLAGPEAGLLELLHADGFAVARPDAVYSRGIVPRDEMVHRLVDRLDQRGEPLVVSDHLAEIMPELADQAEVAAGLLALKVPDYPQHWLLWFRGEFARTVTWGGDHRKGLTPTPKGYRLEPRASFAAWIEVVRGRSRPWTTADRLIAEETIRDHVLGGVIEWRRLLGLRLRTLSEALFAQIDDAVLAIDPVGTVLVWNHNAERILGRPEGDVVGKRLDDPALAIDPVVVERWRTTHAQRGSIDAERWLDLPQGRLWVEERWRAVNDDQGKLLFVLAVLHDATTRKTTMEELKATRNRFQAFMDHVPVSAWIQRDDLEFEFCNRHAQLEHGLGQTNLDPCFLQTPENKEQCRNTTRWVFENGETINFIESIPKADGTTGEYLVIKFPIPNGSDKKLLGGIAINITERNRMERELRAREERYRMAIQNGRVAVWEHDLATDVFTPDPELWTWLGVDPVKAPRTLTEALDYLDPEFLPAVQEQVRRSLEGDRDPFELECCVRTTDGGIRWFLARGQVVCAEAGAPIKGIGTIIDITDRKQAELNFRAFLDHLPIAAWIQRDDLCFDYVNRFLLNYYGLRLDQFHHSAFEKLIPPDRMQAYLQASRRVFETGESLVTIEEYQLADGGVGEAMVVRFPIQSRSGTKLLGGVALDLTERNRMERELRAREERYRMAIQNGRVAVWEYDFATDVFTPDPELYAWLGFDPADPPQTASEILSRLSPEIHQQAIESLEEHIQGKSDSFEYEYFVNMPGNGTRWFLTRGRAIRSDEGDPLKAIGTTIDITERKEIELQLRKSLKEREILLKEVHHRVKNNLAVIVELLGLQARRLGRLDHLAAQALEESRSRIHSLAMVHELLHRREGWSNSLPVPNYLRRLCDLLTQGGSNGFSQIDLRISAEPEELELDLERAVPFGLILNELITNALKHAFAGGRAGRLEVAVRGSSDNRLTLTVGDDGPGTSEGFDWSASPSLGLRLIHNLTAQLDGSIRFVSRPGEGVTALLSFPLKPPNPFDSDKRESGT